MGVAGKHLIAEREAVERHDKRNAHLRAVGAMIAGIAALRLRVCLRLAFEISAGDVVEQNVVVDREQLAATLRQMRFQRLLVASALAAPAEDGDDQGPLAQSLWMLLADFLAAAIPIVPFALLPVAQGRIVSGAVTLLLLIGLGVGRARIGARGVFRTVVETVSIGVAAALAGVAIGVAIARAFGG